MIAMASYQFNTDETETKDGYIFTRNDSLEPEEEKKKECNNGSKNTMRD
jgi:hypothetical protein